MHVTGKLLWENYHSARKYMNSLPDDIERIMTVLETTEGVLGANVISRGYGASIVALVIHYLVSIGAEHWPRRKREN